MSRTFQPSREALDAALYAALRATGRDITAADLEREKDQVARDLEVEVQLARGEARVWKEAAVKAAEEARYWKRAAHRGQVAIAHEDAGALSIPEAPHGELSLLADDVDAPPPAARTARMRLRDFLLHWACHLFGRG